MHSMKSLTLLLRFCFLALLLVLAGIRPATAQAITCNLVTAPSLAFGTTDLMLKPNNDTLSNVTYSCKHNKNNATLLLCLGIGPSPSSTYNPRTMTKDSTSPAMNFNVFTDANYTIIWGANGAGGGYTALAVPLTIPTKQNYTQKTVTLYGRIPSTGQIGLAPGTYTGAYTLTASYKDITNSPSTDCSTGTSTFNTLTFNATATVQANCIVGPPATMDFGTVFQTLDQNIDTTADITVTCNGPSYTVGLGNGINANGTQRRMKGPGGVYLNYGLYSDAQRTSSWGNPGITKPSSNGQPQALTVYGRVPPQPIPGAGLFSDTVTITVSY